LFINKYENDTHAPVYYQYDTYVAEFHKKGKCTHRQLQTNDAERSTPYIDYFSINCVPQLARKGGGGV
jgi:hypothetical protein